MTVTTETGTGSRKDFQYVDDRGSTWSVERDEGSGEAKMGWANNAPCLADWGTTSSGIPLISGHPFMPRYVMAIQRDFPGTRRRFTIGEKVNFDSIMTTTSSTTITISTNESDRDSGIVYDIVGTYPEKWKRLPKSADTGKNDGDAT
jgi:hypothetical protein